MERWDVLSGREKSHFGREGFVHLKKEIEDSTTQKVRSKILTQLAFSLASFGETTHHHAHLYTKEETEKEDEQWSLSTTENRGSSGKIIINTTSPEVLDLLDQESRTWKRIQDLIPDAVLPSTAQVALRFPTEERGDIYPLPQDHWHIDGQWESNVPQFSLLVGIYLTDAEQPSMGSLGVFPRSHQIVGEWMATDYEDLCVQLRSKGAPVLSMSPREIPVQSSDVIFAHPFLAHRASPNTSSSVRIAVYFRISSSALSCSLKRETWQQTLRSDLWADFRRNHQTKEKENQRENVWWGEQKMVVIVTGATRGLGRAICERIGDEIVAQNLSHLKVESLRQKTKETTAKGTFLGKGMKGRNWLVLVTGTSLRVASQTAEDLQKRFELIEKRSGVDLQYRGAELDVTKEESISQFAKEVSLRYGGIDVVINNAGILIKPLSLSDEEIEKNQVEKQCKCCVFKEWMDPQEINLVLSTNFWGPLRVIESLDPLLKDGGRIINVSSLAGKVALDRFDPSIQEMFLEIVEPSRFFHPPPPVSLSISILESILQCYHFHFDTFHPCYSHSKKAKREEKSQRNKQTKKEFGVLDQLIQQRDKKCMWGEKCDPYGMSKLALDLLTRLWDQKFKSRAISVTAIDPGILDTAMLNAPQSSWNDCPFKFSHQEKTERKKGKPPYEGAKELVDLILASEQTALFARGAFLWNNRVLPWPTLNSKKREQKSEWCEKGRKSGVPWIAIIGVGGSGKTTLLNHLQAQFTQNSKRKGKGAGSNVLVTELGTIDYMYCGGSRSRFVAHPHQPDKDLLHQLGLNWIKTQTRRGIPVVFGTHAAVMLGGRPTVIITDSDFNCFSHVILLNYPLEVVMARQKSDKERKRGYTEECVQNWLKLESETVNMMCQRHQIELLTISDPEVNVGQLVFEILDSCDTSPASESLISKIPICSRRVSLKDPLKNQLSLASLPFLSCQMDSMLTSLSLSPSSHLPALPQPQQPLVYLPFPLSPEPLLSLPPGCGNRTARETLGVVCSELAEALFRGLNYLDLSGFRLGDLGVKVLTPLLESLPSSLLVLRLESNEIGDNGAASLARALSSNRTLTKIDLYDNLISDDGAIAFANSPLCFPGSHLRMLDFWGNNIGDSGAEALFCALSRSPSLEKILLNHNCLTCFGWSRIVDTILDAYPPSFNGPSEVSVPSNVFLEGHPVIPQDPSFLCESVSDTRALLVRHLEKRQSIRARESVGVEWWERRDLEFKESDSHVLSQQRELKSLEFFSTISSPVSSDFSAPFSPPHLPPAHKYLLTDEQVSSFIALGHVTISTTTELSMNVHKKIWEIAEKMYNTEHNPGNNILPRIPLLREVLYSGPVIGAITSLLGHNYIIHPHRHSHKGLPFRPPQSWHRDSHWGYDRLRGNVVPEFLFLFYYPKAVETGPTELMEGSQYYSRSGGESHRRVCDRTFHEWYIPQWEVSPRKMVCPGDGEVVLAHFDVWHRGGSNNSFSNRHMIKFIVQRTGMPTEPTWNHTTHGQPSWKNYRGQALRESLWNALWDFRIYGCSSCTSSLNFENREEERSENKGEEEEKEKMGEGERLKKVLEVIKQRDKGACKFAVGSILSLDLLEGEKRGNVLFEWRNDFQGMSHDVAYAAALYPSFFLFSTFVSLILSFCEPIEQNSDPDFVQQLQAKFLPQLQTIQRDCVLSSMNIPVERRLQWRSVEMILFSLGLMFPTIDRLEEGRRREKEGEILERRSEIAIGLLLYLLSLSCGLPKTRVGQSKYPKAHPRVIDAALTALSSLSCAQKVKPSLYNEVIWTLTFLTICGVGLEVGWVQTKSSCEEEEEGTHFLPLTSMQATSCSALLKWVTQPNSKEVVDPHLWCDVADVMGNLVSHPFTFLAFPDRYILGYAAEVCMILTGRASCQTNEKKEENEEGCGKDLITNFFLASRWCPLTSQASGY